MRLKSAGGIVWILSFINGAYLMAFGEPTLAYFLNILAHLGLGAALIALVSLSWRRAGKLLLAAFGLAAISGIAVFIIGGTRSHQSIMTAHIAAAFTATFVLGFQQSSRRWIVPLMAAVAAIPLLYSADNRSVIQNPASPPLTMAEEGGGEKGPFFPSSLETTSGGHVSTEFIMDSKSCAKCHAEIYDQWKASMHHFSSFNNPFYRRAIEYMQPVTGVQASKWCAGCHDPAVLLNGMMDRPIAEIADTPEGQSGMGCLSCHAISKVKSTMGNSDVVIDDAKWSRMFSFLTRVNSKPHRISFLKTFHTDQPSEFCSSCHKVHLDTPVNSYRWIRGFNEYDNWQGSGVSGLGARSFYYPKTPQTCVSCHMPTMSASDPAARDGKIRSHFFPGANTGVPVVIKDEQHLGINKTFLQSARMRVDIFAASRATAIPENQPLAATASTSFAVGEESEGTVPRSAAAADTGDVYAPLNKVATAFRPGDEVRIDVVVRTLGLGHFFPGGTVDAFDTWLELKGTDDSGAVVFWSGAVQKEGGPVDPDAHFYRSLQIDQKGNPINKRNAFESRATVYVNLIPPGSADVAHYLLKIPRNLKGAVHLKATLNYRKFAAVYSAFTFEGKPENPTLPIVEMASASLDLPIGKSANAGKSEITQADAERWNDYGIGLYRQGDFTAAIRAFTKVTEINPSYPDGWVNVARVLIDEGETTEAQKWLAKALQLSPDLGRAHFFLAMALKADGNYEGAQKELELVAAQYPLDRVVLNQIGKVLFLKREYQAAVTWFKRTISVDPEDISAHYNLMLCYRGMNDAGASAREEKLYLRFKADENAQTLTGEYRRNHPIDNNERQPIHMHEGNR